MARGDNNELVIMDEQGPWRLRPHIILFSTISVDVKEILRPRP